MYDHETVINQLRSMVDWAYETGYHECGYDPVDEVKAEIERLRAQMADASALLKDAIPGSGGKAWWTRLNAWLGDTISQDAA